jgi:AcrR family transcriptional regulator
MQPLRVSRAAPLSRERILDAASELLRAEGARAFSMRRLAARLDVTPMALYRWFANRDALLQALTERVLDDMVSPADSSAPWPDRVLAVARSLRAQLLEHRDLLQLVGAPRQLSGMMAVTSDRLLGLTRELGYDEAGAIEAYRILFWTMVNHCLVAEVGDVVPAFLGDYEAERVVQGALDSTDAPLPNIETLLPWFAGVDRDEFFDQMVRTVAAGLHARVGHSTTG